MDNPDGSRVGGGIVIEDDDITTPNRQALRSTLFSMQLDFPSTSIMGSPPRSLLTHCTSPKLRGSSLLPFPSIRQKDPSLSEYGAKSSTTPLGRALPVQSRQSSLPLRADSKTIARSTLSNPNPKFVLEIKSKGDSHSGPFPQPDIDLSKDNMVIPPQTSPPSTPTNILIDGCHDNAMPSAPKKRRMETLSEWVEGPTKLKPNKSVELGDGDFIRIESIHKDIETTEVFLRGWRFRRVSDMNGILKKNTNELCLVMDLTEDDHLIDNRWFRAGDSLISCHQGLEDVPLSEYKKVRKLIMTNLQFPACSFRVSNDRRLPKDQIFHEAVLVCRAKYVVFYKRDKFRMPGAWSEKAVVWLNSGEADPGFSMSDEESRHAWRGETEMGGSRVGFLDGELAFDKAERTVTEAGMAPRREKQFVGGVSLPASETATSPYSVPGTRASSPINLDPDSRTGQKRRRRAGVWPRAKVELLYQISSNTRANLSLETAPISDSEEEVQEMSPLDSTCMLGEYSVDRPTKRRRTKRAVSPELYEIHLVNRLKMGTLETDINSSFTPTMTPLTPERIRAPVTPPSTPVNPIPRGRKRTVREDEVIELPARPLTPDTRSASTRRRLFTVTTVSQNPDPFISSNHTKPDLSEAPAFLGSKNKKGKATKAGILPSATSGSTTLLKTHLLTPVTSRPSSPLRAMSPFTLRQNPIRRYTFGDAFCGAGGTSRGAKMAGLRVEWGFDFAVNPITSYQSNFFGANAYHSSADLFTQLQYEDHRVDILHLSPPCQPFSAAHTVAGKDDDMNEATFLGAAAIIKKAKPRVVTLEQTSGLLERRGFWFTAMIHLFTELGFSVRWKMLNMADYGLAQARKRLILIASCPGESLPPYPNPTHAPKTAVTVNQVLRNIPDGFPNHDGAIARNFPAWDGDVPLKYTITCSGGGGNYHPSGKRDFTLREFACLQGFPLEHKFAGNAVKKQIGNAVPPCAAKAFYDEIIRHMKKIDGVQ